MIETQSIEQATHPRITVIGGGHGTAAIYPEVAELTPYATALVSMSDRGGRSTGRIMDEFGNALPPGDITRVIIAASQNEAIRNQVSRLPGDGPLGGHTPWNTVMTGFMLEHGVARGVRLFSEAMQARGRILPITLERHELVMQDGSNEIRGEHNIDVHAVESVEPWIHHEPPVGINPEAIPAITEADMVVYAPGSPYTSELAALCVGGVRESLRETKALRVLVVNGFNEQHDTKDWHVADYVNVLLRHNIPIDVVLYSTYAPGSHDKQPVAIEDERFAELPTVQTIGAVVLSAEQPGKHDAQAVAKHLFALLPANLDKLST